MKLDLAKNTEIFVVLSLIIVSPFTLIKIAIAAPENFNPELESAPEPNNNQELGDLTQPKFSHPAGTIEEEETETSSEKPSIDRRSLPSPNLSNQSAIESGTADIELTIENSTNSRDSDSALVVNNLKFDFQLDFDNFGQSNLLINQQIDFNLHNLDFAIDTGIGLFKQDEEEIETVNNIPLYLSWQTKLGKTDLTLTGGVDFFNRLTAVPSATIKASSPLFSSVAPNGKLKSLFVLSGQIRHQGYKFNAETLENGINFWRFTPSIYWQIRPNLSLFTLGQYGRFNDGNRELQSFSRLEKKFGAFSIAANLFTWDFEEDLSQESGYFSPSGFLVYNGELGWQGTMFDETLDCKLSAALGKQTLTGTTDNAWTYKALCEAQILPNLNVDLGYIYSNVRDRSDGSTNFGNNTIKGKLYIEL